MNKYYQIVIVLMLFSCSQQVELKDDQALAFLKFHGKSGYESVAAGERSFDGGYVFVGSYSKSIVDTQKDIYFVITDAFGNRKVETYFGDPDTVEIGKAIVLTKDGNYAILADKGFPGAFGLNLIKLDKMGNIQKEKYFSYPNEDIQGVSLLEAEDGNFYILGKSTSNGSSKMILLKTDSSMNVIWNEDYYATEGDNEVGRSLLQSIDGLITWCGTFQGDKSSLRTVSVTTEGDIKWSRKDYDYQKTTFGKDIRKAVGGYIIAGTWIDGAQNSNVYLMKINNSSNTEWIEPYNDGNVVQRFVESIDLVNDGGYILTGTSLKKGNGNEDYNIFLIKTDSNGKKLWEREFGGFLSDKGVTVRQTGDGGFIIFANTKYDNDDAVCLIKTNAEGKLE